MNKRKSSMGKAFLTAFPKTIPVLTGFLALGIAYGILMEKNGYSAVWSVLMSAIAFCGSMQYVAITLLTAAFNPLQAFIMSILVNGRHVFYGLSMLPKFKGLGKVRGFLIFTLCDETFSIECSVEPPEGVERKYFYFFISLLDYLYWSLGSFLGGVVGNLIKFNTKGLDFALTALFIVLFLEQWKKKENRLSCIFGIVCTIIALLVVGATNFVIPAMVLILFILTIERKKLCC